MLTTVQFTIVEGPDEGCRYEFHQREIKVGRDFQSDLILNHGDVAETHFRISGEKDEIFLEDLGSQSGTKLNGLFVTREPLHNGDELQVGPYVFHISLRRQEMPEDGMPGLEVLEEGGEARSGGRRAPLLAVAILLVVAVVYLGIRFTASERILEDLSGRGPVSLPVQGVFGHKVGGKNYVDKAEFSFVAKWPKYRLEYRPGFIRSAQQVRIYLNDRQLADVPVTVDRWADELVHVDIPQPLLRMNETNIIRFDNRKNPPERTAWGVREITLREMPIPRCDVDVAKKYLRLAEEKYEERRIHEPNLHDAILSLKEGLEYVIACEDTSIQEELVRTMALYEKELQQKYEDYIFNWRKFMKLNDREAAMYELDQILRHIPNESDRRHRKAKELLDKLRKR